MTADVVYFSATGTTEKVVRDVAEGMNIPCNFINMTPAKQRENLPMCSGDMLILASPVYGGRVPDFVYDAFSALQGNWKYFVGIVVFGNVQVGGALQDLARLGRKKNAIPVGYAAFVGEHSFADADLPIALGRPNTGDLEQAVQFGKGIERNAQKRKCVKLDNFTDKSDKFEERPTKTASLNCLTKKPSIVGTCTRCGTCASICPTEAIDCNTLQVNEKKCIRCYACVKACPCHARQSGVKWCVVRMALRKMGSNPKGNKIYL